MRRARPRCSPSEETALEARALQMDALKKAERVHIFQDKLTGATSSVRHEGLKDLRAGDTLIVWIIPGGIRQASKTKFGCPDCGQNAWAKPDALLICSLCYEDGEGDIWIMLAEPTEEAEAAAS